MYNFVVLYYVMILATKKIKNQGQILFRLGVLNLV